MELPDSSSWAGEVGPLATGYSLSSNQSNSGHISRCSVEQAGQTKYEARIVGLQRAKQEAVAKAEAQSQKAAALQQELDKLTTEKSRSAASMLA